MSGFSSLVYLAFWFLVAGRPNGQDHPRDRGAAYAMPQIIFICSAYSSCNCSGYIAIESSYAPRTDSVAMGAADSALRGWRHGKARVFPSRRLARAQGCCRVTKGASAADVQRLYAAPYAWTWAQHYGSKHICMLHLQSGSLGNENSRDVMPSGHEV